MSNTTDIVIIGGGTAGWLTACVLAADRRHQTQASPQAQSHAPSNIQFNTQFKSQTRITLIESANVPTIGVGEGTWPSMRSTLKRIGISETALIRECDASFKQGSSFRGWRTGEKQDQYYHPFSLPAGYQELDIAKYWLPFHEQVSFANAVAAQGRICDLGLAPKTITTPEYGFALNYGYHLDAGKFATLLKKHGTESLGIKHIVDDVVAVEGNKDEPIRGVVTQQHGKLTADLYVDCSGFAGLLLDKHYGVPFRSESQVLFNDSAIAIQCPYANETDPIASATLATAQANGWIWDIALPTRRGTGYVYTSDFISHDKAEEALRQYLAKSASGVDIEQLSARRIPIQPGYRETFWHHNCVAVGLSAGFIEPLEASAIALVEVAAKFISDQLPARAEQVPIVAKRFNQTMGYHWEKVIDFLKLHYVLSQRTDSDYWLAHRDSATYSDQLKESLVMWETQSPNIYDCPMAMEMFPAASFQYILYGMKSDFPMIKNDVSQVSKADTLFQEVAQKTNQLSKALPNNRTLLQQIYAHGLGKV